jgi:hypothetical protein
MSMHKVHLTQTTDWQNWVVSSAAVFSTSTDDPSLSTVSAPMPMLQFDLGGKTTTPFAIARPMTLAAAAALQPAGPTQTAPPPEPAEQAADDAPAAKVEEQSEKAGDEVEQVVAATPEPEEPTVKPAPSEEKEPSPEASSQVELIIDSLTNHTLIEPIPVTIDALGGMMFTASMRDCDIQITGSSIGEALLVLKERIESVYDDLNRRWQHLDTEKREQLKMLHTYIAPPSKRSERHLGRR